MTLATLAMDTQARITGFGGITEVEELRLSGLGLREGQIITKILRTPLRDPVECLVGPQLIALEASLLEHILVEERRPCR